MARRTTKRPTAASARPKRPRQPPRRSPSQTSTALPTRQDILAFVADAPDKVGKREIARAFAIRGSDKIALKALLREMQDEGLIEGSRKRISEPGRLPPVGVLTITGRDDDGEFYATPQNWDAGDGEPPRVLIADPAPKRGASAGLGDRILTRITAVAQDERDGYAWTGSIIKRLATEDRRLLGIYRASTTHNGGSIEPVDRRQLQSHRVRKGDESDAGDGDLVRFTLSGNRRLAAPQAKVVETLGNPRAQKQISLIAVHAHGIPEDFPQKALDELDGLPELTDAGRTDLRDTPLLTIDPPDARDHDDALWAGPDPDPKNQGGWIVIVAIADVAAYVRPGTALDRSARERANSVYFPDRVVPMLPEKISTDLCSLREGEDRPCVAVRMNFDATGQKRGHTFLRAIMRSRAKLSYVQAQAAIDGEPDDQTAPLLADILRPLWSAYEALAKARRSRSPLALELPERKLELNDEGQVARVTVPDRLDAHKLVEEFMIQANVAAAEVLEGRRRPLIYRAHDAPTPEKLIALREFLETLDIPLAKSGNLQPRHFNTILAKVMDTPHAPLVNEVILRSQSQAEYTEQNYGHFGLNLQRYAHFTSPIRRYADLIVHRALISALKLGDDGLSPDDIEMLAETATLISERERRAMAAERETTDRLIAGYLADRVGSEFKGRISGIIAKGLFVRLDDTGADGFVPAARIRGDRYWLDEDRRALIGERTSLAYVLGDAVDVRLVEAVPDAGALRFDLLSDARKLRGASTRRTKRRGRPTSATRTPRRRR